jgi:hypothetical protein
MKTQKQILDDLNELLAMLNVLHNAAGEAVTQLSLLKAEVVNTTVWDDATLAKLANTAEQLVTPLELTITRLGFR